MRPIATCQRCTARFVADEAAGDGSPARKAVRPLCESCRHAAAEERLRTSRTSFYACVSATILFAAQALNDVMHPRPLASVSWKGFLGMAIPCGVLAVFYYFFRVRPQMKLVAAALEADGDRRESPDVRRARRLREAGHAIDWNHERRVLRKQSERLNENLVDCGYLSYDELRQERRQNRLLNRIDEVDEQLRRTSDLIEKSDADRAAQDELERRRSCLMAELARPPSVWPRIVDGSVSLLVGFFELLMVFVFSMAALAAFRQGRLAAAALILVVLLAKCLPVAAWWQAWRQHHSSPAGLGGAQTAETE